ncbi:MAG: Fic family protein [Burkholderiales bacterium]|nr:Fic family protein [Burkholderiales bacterium]
MQSTQLLWQAPGWPAMRYDGRTVADEVTLARRAQGLVEGKLTVLGFDDRQALVADAWTDEAVSTAAIEGEQLDLLAVRSSVATRLGVGSNRGAAAPRHVDGLLDIMDDAVRNAGVVLTHERLCRWQAALFPTGLSGMRVIKVGAYRDRPIQIVSGPTGHEVVHYEAPPAAKVKQEMQRLLAWFNQGSEDDLLVRAAIGHLWFETIHPFDDGNGRVGRVLVDLALARDSGEASRLMRISHRLLENRDQYYNELGHAQHGDGEVTQWVVWFVRQVRVACEQAATDIDASIEKAAFWARHRKQPINDRQRKVLNAMLDAGRQGFTGGMSTRKYESMTSSSRATASRDLIELEVAGMLRKVGAGRSTRYYVSLDGWGPAEQVGP